MGMREGIMLSKGFEICFLELQYGSAPLASRGGNTSVASAHSSPWLPTAFVAYDL